MAVSLVGTGTFIKSTINGTSTALTISTGAAAAGDLCIAWWVHTRGALTSVLASSAGTAYTNLEALTNGNLAVQCAYRILTSSETTVASCNTGSVQDSVVLSAIVLRGVNQTPFVNDNSTIGTSSNPNGPAAVVEGPNDAVVTLAGMLTATAMSAAPTGFTNLVSSSASDTRSCAGGLAFLSTNRQTINPSSWTGGAAVAWIATTVTVRSTESNYVPFLAVI